MRNLMSESRALESSLAGTNSRIMAFCSCSRVEKLSQFDVMRLYHRLVASHNNHTAICTSSSGRILLQRIVTFRILEMEERTFVEGRSFSFPE